MSQNALHLDTHVVCWLYAGLVHQLSDTAVHLLEANELATSPWALLEMQVLFERGILHVGPDEIIVDLERRIGLRVAAVDATKLVRASFSLAWAADPFDRMIVAHASLLEAPLLTKDAHLHAHFGQAVW